MLFIHGTPGGDDASLAMGRFLVNSGFELLAPSRPGYLGTPLGENRTFDRQADLLAAMARELGYERLGVLAWSGGAAVAYRLAVRHPELVSALVPFAGVSKRYESRGGFADWFAMQTRPGNWLVRFAIRRMPGWMVSSTLGAEGDLTRKERRERTALVMGDEHRRQVVLELAWVIGDYPRRREGVTNDREQFRAITSLELDQVKAPTLVIHGSVDTDVPPDHGEDAAAEIPDSELLLMDRGTHLCLYTHPDAESAQRRAAELLRQR